MKKVSDLQVGTALQASELPLPAEIQEALGELVGAAREGLLALSVGAGLSLVSRLMELEVERLAGPKGSQNPDWVAKRHGYEQGSVTLGGRRVTIRRPRVRFADDSQELPLATYEYFASRDPLTQAVLDRMLAGVSTRRFVTVGEPVGQEVEREASATSKSTVSELFVQSTRTALGELMARRLDDVRLAAMMVDGLEIAERTHVVALGITTDGVKLPLGLWEGSTENATVARELLADWSSAGSIPSRRSCSWSMAARRSGARSRTCSANVRWCIAVTVTKSAMSATTCPTVSVTAFVVDSGKRGCSQTTVRRAGASSSW